MLSELQDRIARREARLAVIGLGYVGLPVACMFAEAGFHVSGVEIRADRVARINAGESPIEGEEPGLAELLAQVVATGRLRATTDYEALRDCDIVLIDVETPVDEDHVPRYGALRSACRALGPVLKPGALVIVESTIAPGTIDRVVRPLLEESSGSHSGVDFYLGACPERVMPGKLLSNLRSLSRVCGGETPEVSATMMVLYRAIIPQADLDAADCVTAELVKTTENAFRDVNIAFANEVALICEAVGANVDRVRELVNKSPGRNMHVAGAGVGGHCIPKDPWLLAYGAQGRAELRLIPTARAVNDGMPLHVAALLEEALAERGQSLRGARVLVMGYAYLENSDDTRNSPSEVLVGALRAAGADVRIHDPWVEDYQGDVLAMAQGCDAAVVMVAHTAYKALDPGQLGVPVLVDGRRIYDPVRVHAAGITYRGVGVGKRT